MENKLAQLDEKLAEKELLIADYYARTGSTAAADLYYQRITDDWPASTAAQTASQKLPEIKKELQRQAQPQTGKKKFNWKGLFL